MQIKKDFSCSGCHMGGAGATGARFTGKLGFVGSKMPNRNRCKTGHKKLGDYDKYIVDALKRKEKRECICYRS